MAKAAIHFGPSALQAAVKLVDFEAVDLADGLSLSDPNSRLQGGHSGLFTLSLTEVKFPVVHH